MTKIVRARAYHFEAVVRSGRRSLKTIIGLVFCNLLLASAALSSAITWDQSTAILLNHDGIAANSLSQLIKGPQVYGVYYNGNYDTGPGYNNCGTPCGTVQTIIDGRRTLTFNPIQAPIPGGGGNYGSGAHDTGISSLNYMTAVGWQGAGGRSNFDWQILGLTTGRKYKIQVFTWGRTQYINRTLIAVSDPSLPSFVTGTFTADAATQLLNLNNMSAILITAAGPDSGDTNLSMQRNVSGLRHMFAIQASFLNPGLSYDCALFDKHGLCVAFSGRYTQALGADAPDVASGAFVASYRVDKNIRLGAFVEQNLTDMSSGGVTLDNSAPDFGVFGVWQERDTGEGLKIRGAYRYGNKSVSIARDAIGTAEAGRGRSRLVSQGAQVTLSKGYRLNEQVLATPYVGLRYVNMMRAGYAEAESDTVTTPLTYATLRQDSLSLLSGIGLSYAATPNISFAGSFGLEADLVQKFSDYAASGVDGLEKIKFGEGTRRIRGVASAGATYQLDQTHQLNGQVQIRQEAFSSTSTATAMLTYIAAF